MRRPRSEHIACHIAHVRDWPLHANVYVTWGVQGWVPGVVVGYQRSRVVVRITGLAQSGFDPSAVLSWRRRQCVSRSPNNIIARRKQPPRKYLPASCLAMTEALAAQGGAR